MADIYTPTPIPEEYDPSFWRQELERIAIAIQELEVPWIILSPQGTPPDKTKNGMVVNADGTNWNPGAGAGLYERVGGSWNKL